MVLSASDEGSCLGDLIPAYGGGGSFNLSLRDPVTDRIDSTGPLGFDASANEVGMAGDLRRGRSKSEYFAVVFEEV